MPPRKSADHISKIVAKLQAEFGNDSAMRLGKTKHASALITEVLPTGIEVIDRYLLAVGGNPVGRISEISGVEGSCKTSIAYASCATAQRAGATVAFIDAECEIDEERAASVFGVKMDDLILCEPLNLEMALEQIITILTVHDVKNGPLLIVWDSVAASRSKAEIAKKAGERSPGSTASILSTMMPKLVKLVQEKRAHLLCLNQIRDNIGVMFGPKTTTPGGRALKFFASWRAQIFGGKAVKDKSGKHTGKIVTIVVGKTRFSEPFRKARVLLNYATGFDNDWTTLEHAKAMKLLDARKGPKGKAVKGPAAAASARLKLGWGVPPGQPTEAPEGAKEEEE